MDDHVVVGGRYFKLDNTSYTLTSDARGTRLDIEISYRVNTGFNWYAVPMAKFLISNEADTLLNFYKHRAELERVKGQMDQHLTMDSGDSIRSLIYDHMLVLAGSGIVSQRPDPGTLLLG